METKVKKPAPPKTGKGKIRKASGKITKASDKFSNASETLPKMSERLLLKKELLKQMINPKSKVEVTNKAATGKAKKENGKITTKKRNITENLTNNVTTKKSKEKAKEKDETENLTNNVTTKKSKEKAKEKDEVEEISTLSQNIKSNHKRFKEMLKRKINQPANLSAIYEKLNQPKLSVVPKLSERQQYFVMWEEIKRRMEQFENSIIKETPKLIHKPVEMILTSQDVHKDNRSLIRDVHDDHRSMIRDEHKDDRSMIKDVPKDPSTTVKDLLNRQINDRMNMSTSTSTIVLNPPYDGQELITRIPPVPVMESFDENGYLLLNTNTEITNKESTNVKLHTLNKLIINESKAKYNLDKIKKLKENGKYDEDKESEQKMEMEINENKETAKEDEETIHKNEPNFTLVPKITLGQPEYLTPQETLTDGMLVQNNSSLNDGTVVQTNTSLFRRQDSRLDLYTPHLAKDNDILCFYEDSRDRYDHLVHDIREQLREQLRNQLSSVDSNEGVTLREILSSDLLVKPEPKISNGESDEEEKIISSCEEFHETTQQSYMNNSKRLEELLKMFDSSPSEPTMQETLQAYCEYKAAQSPVAPQIPAICNHLVGDYNYDPYAPNWLDLGISIVERVLKIFNFKN